MQGDQKASHFKGSSTLYILITTSQKPAIGTQKRERNSNITHQIIREESKNRRNKKGITNTTRKQQNVNKYIPSKTYFKYKWINIPINWHRVAKWIKKKAKTKTQD